NMETQAFDKAFIPYISASEIDVRATQMAERPPEGYDGAVPVLLVVLTGAFTLAAGRLTSPRAAARMPCVKMASYEGTDSSGEVTQLLGLDLDITDRHVVLVEDIVDTGNTIVALHSLINRFKIKSLRVATLFFNPDAYRKNVKIDYVGF